MSAGRLPLDVEAQWIDYTAAGAADAADFDRVATAVLAKVDLAEDVFLLGLRAGRPSSRGRPRGV